MDDFELDSIEHKQCRICDRHFDARELSDSGQCPACQGESDEIEHAKAKASKILIPLADQLERLYGECPESRADLLAWVDDQLDRCAILGVPGEVAQRMIETGYIEWVGELLREQPEDQARERLDDA